MKKRRFLTALAFLCLIAVPALAATVHYGFILPIVGASVNTWGTVLNLVFNNIDTAIWNASQGTTIGVNSQSSATTVTLTNPVNNFQSIGFTASAQKLVLPPMNAASSLVVGGTLVINNAGSNAFAIDAQDGSTVIVSSLAPGNFVRLTLTANGTANGTFTVEGPYLTAVGTLSLGASATSANPSISGDITSGFYTPGASTVAVTVGGVEAMQWNTLSSSVNYLSISPSQTTFAPTIASAGTDVNIGLNINPKGTGIINLNGPTAISTTLGVTGAATLSSTLSVTGTSTLTGAVSLVAGGTSITPASNDSSTNIATTAFANPGNSQGANGYVTLPSGVIIQWGTNTTSGSTGRVSVSFPHTFPNNTFSITMTALATSIDQTGFTIQSGTISTGGFIAQTINEGNPGTPLGAPFYWMAVGN